MSRHGHAFIDRGLYLPKEWTDDPDRLKAAHVPDDVGLATKPQIARRMIARALVAKVPFAYVAADSVYGTGDIETMLRKAGKGYVLGVAANQCSDPGQEAAYRWHRRQDRAEPSKSAWRRLSSGEGTKGPRLHEWAYLELADLDAAEYNSALTGEWTRGLLIRRNIADGALAFFSTWCPRGTPREKLVSVKVIAGLSRTASRPPRTSSASITTRPAPGMAGIGMSRWSCSPSPWWPPSVITPITCRSKKHCHVFRKGVVPDLLVDSRNPPYRDQARTTAHPSPHVIAWSFWRRAHQAEARSAHLKRKTQL